jgi:hypothetical protein
MSSTLRSPPTPGATLARLCLEHVAREEAQLGATRDAVGAIRDALLGKNQDALAAALERHEEAARRGEELNLRRDAFRRDVARKLGVPHESVTLDLLADRFPDMAGAIAQSQARLRQLAAEVERLNHSNAALLSYCLDFLQRFFDQLTGTPRVRRYGPSGALTASSIDSLINARG